MSSVAERLDRLRLLLGEGEDLLDARAEVPERDLAAELRRGGGPVAASCCTWSIWPASSLDLRVGLLPFGGERGDLVLGAGDVALDLLFLVSPEGGLEAGLEGRVPAETEDFPAVRHAFHPHIRIVP